MRHPLSLVPLLLFFFFFAAPGCGPGADELLVPGGPGRFGLVRAAVTQQTLGGRPVFQSHALAAFLDLGDTARRCSRRAEGPCVLYRCEPGVGTAQLPNAGPLTVGAAGAAVTLPVVGSGGYEPYSHGSAALWQGGQALPLRAPGGLVPALSAEVVMPGEPFALQRPLVSPVLSVTVERGQPLGLAFSAGPRPVSLLLLQGLLLGPGAALSCTFPAGQGEATVPAELLSAFLPTDGSSNTALLLAGPAAASVLPVGPWSVDIAAIGTGSSATVILR